ncbi:MAG: helix-turn-helix transcriptional regulator [Lachnospiraceae bacterium]|nr:helix-turn-helix transcriptional regulator [Lachnospiraceae bacterium]MCM1230018.1 helix-turn-helix transcriptional regulator [Ruminococcus flavefaciens]
MKNNIRELREQNGISRKELAELSGVHYNKISDYENNYIKTENITVGNIYRIAKALKCTIEDLLISD